MSEINPLDALLLAIEIEELGREYYNKAAKLTEDPELRKLLTELAEIEEVHSVHFKKMLADKRGNQNSTGSGPEQKTASPQVTGYLTYLFDLDIFRNTLKNMPKSQEDILRVAIDAEKSAIIFYTEIKNMTQDEETHAVLEKILHEEKIHFMQLSEKLKILRKKQ